MNTCYCGVHVSLQIRIFIFSRYIPRGGIIRLYVSSIFRFLSTFILFSIVAVPIYILTNVVGGFLFFPHPFWYLIFIDFLRIANLADVRWYPVVVLISISLIISIAKHFFIRLLATCVSSLVKLICLGLLPFFWLFAFWYWAVQAICLFWILTPCQSHHLQIFFSLSIDCLFILLLFLF